MFEILMSRKLTTSLVLNNRALDGKEEVTKIVFLCKNSEKH